MLYIEQEIIAHPILGRQLSEGYIRKQNSKEKYGDDVIIEVVSRHAMAS
ncbi:hypothetical protein [Pontiella sulfatireligans]|uniref:Uncharacterized protein n=1 Tax=Pontiella sulfatireligans TaxID=2750658 RepID=A0A6C2UIA2_9BACT|nr:hypothetical protein [Pontiella sulfatireligans]VGO19920.1 hypothetical protein SCARR_01980 [Pontiella sulfatireligans]